MGKEQKISKSKNMALSGHLKKLRNRLLICLAVLIVAFVPCLANAFRIVDLLIGIGKVYGYQHVFITPPGVADAILLGGPDW